MRFLIRFGCLLIFALVTPIALPAGGGSRNRLLNQLTADAAKVDVVAGPTEATASGNVLVQAIAGGAVSELTEARKIIHRSFDTETFYPKTSSQHEALSARFDQICGNSPL